MLNAARFHLAPADVERLVVACMTDEALDSLASVLRHMCTPDEGVWLVCSVAVPEVVDE